MAGPKMTDFFVKLPGPAPAPAPVTNNIHIAIHTNSNNTTNACHCGKRERKACVDKSSSDESDSSESDIDSDFEEKKPKRRRTKKGRLRKTPTQNRAQNVNRISKTRDAYAEQKDTDAYIDTETNLIREVHAKVDEVRTDMKFTMNRQLAEVIPRVKTERITYNIGGTVCLQGDGSIKTNKLNHLVMKAAFGALSDEDRKRATDIGFCMDAAKKGEKPVPEHRTPNSINYSKSNMDMIVLQGTNLRFKSKRMTGAAAIQSKFPGVQWHNQGKKWCVNISGVPGSKDKSRGLFHDEDEAFERVLEVWDAAHAPSKHAKWRSAIILYNDDGVFAPYLKTFDTFSALVEHLRPALY